MKFFLLSLLLLTTFNNYAIAKISDSEINTWANEYTKIHNSAAIVGVLLKKVNPFSEPIDTLSSDLFNKKLPRLTYDSTTTTFKFSNGTSLQILSVEDRLYKVNGQKFKLPEEYEKLLQTQKISSRTWTDLFINSAHADDTLPEYKGCVAVEGSEDDSLRQRVIGSIPGIVLFPAFVLNNKTVAYTAAPKCNDQILEINKLLRSSNVSLRKFSCSSDYEFSFDLKNEAKIISNKWWRTVKIFRPTTMDSTENSPYEWSSLNLFFSSGEAYTSKGVLAYTAKDPLNGREFNGFKTIECKKDSNYFQKHHDIYKSVESTTKYINENNFCTKCNLSEFTERIGKSTANAPLNNKAVK